MKDLVVDASVVGGAGDGKSLKPEGRPCREFFMAMLERNRITWTEEIETEWRNHAGGFARRWLVQMFARRKVTRITVVALAGLCDRICSALSNDTQRAAATKDCHLLYAAIAS